MGIILKSSSDLDRPVQLVFFGKSKIVN